jgi:predicted nucleic acid-binding Zn ribbon protein
MEELKNCIGCQKPVRGRTDKKFCTEHCRNNYNNQMKAADNNLIRNINNALSRNRRILQQTLGENLSIAKVDKEKLLMKGFMWRYYTHTEQNKKGNDFKFCYDLGYRIINEEQAVIVRKKASGQ